jgi:hypothetical protein
MMPSPEGSQTVSQFEKLLVALAKDRIDFAVVGGLAVILNGYPRIAVGASILVSTAPENLRKLLDCLSRWGEGFARELKVEDFPLNEGSIRICEDFDLDVFTLMRGRTLDDFRSRIRRVTLGGVSVPVISPGDLVFLKSGSWREKDQLDVLAMKEIMAREAAGQGPATK